MIEQQFDDWLKRHPCDLRTLWYIQNCLGTVLGTQHPLSQAAIDAWRSANSPHGQIKATRPIAEEADSRGA